MPDLLNPREIIMSAQRMTQRAAERAPSGRHCDGAGLWLDVSASGARSWFGRYRIAGRDRSIGFGSLASITIDQARDAARKMRESVARGIDPLTEKCAEKRGPVTFGQAAENYLAARADGWCPAHAATWRASIRAYVLPVIGETACAAIDTGMVTRVLDPIWSRSPVTASRVRGRIESVLAYATVRGWRSGENPSRWRGHLENIYPALPSVTHLEAIAWQDVPSLVASLIERDTPASRCLALAALTACRSSEAMGADWAEIDVARALWVIPAARMKAGREHRIPLTASAIALLGTPLTGPVFGPLAKNALRAEMERAGIGATVHGLRSAFRDWVAEATAHDPQAAEYALAHTPASGVVQAYQRGDMLAKRARIMADWADFCLAKNAPGSVAVLADYSKTA